MKRALLFVNTKASQAEGTYEQAETALREGGLEVIRGDACDGSDYARCMQKFGPVDLIVTGGGDGTLKDGVKAVLKAGPTIPIGILPLGTANNVARTLGIPFDVKAACKIITDGHTVNMDLGRVNGELFVSVAGMGLSTTVHDEVPAEQKRRWGALSYAIHAIKVLIRRPPTFRVTIKYDEGLIRRRALQVTVVNGRFYGGHVEVHPDATITEGLLDLSIIEADSYLKGFFKALLPLKSGHRSPGLQLVRSPRFEIITVPPMKIDVEGTSNQKTPAIFEVLPGAIRVFAPEGAK